MVANLACSNCCILHGMVEGGSVGRGSVAPSPVLAAPPALVRLRRKWTRRITRVWAAAAARRAVLRANISRDRGEGECVGEGKEREGGDVKLRAKERQRHKNESERKRIFESVLDCSEDSGKRPTFIYTNKLMLPVHLPHILWTPVPLNRIFVHLVAIAFIYQCSNSGHQC